jgi:hypothetical protein
MLSKTKWLAMALSLALAPIGCTSGSDQGNERWATTEDTNVEIDWNKVNEAYKAAEGPEDLEKRINEIYKGSETISISVHDADDKTQVVTGFFDKNSSGAVDEGEKIFTIKRDIVGDGQAQMQTQGHGAYAGYHSPMLSIATGMLLGSMMSRAFMPGYAPMYTQPYNTSPSRLSNMRQSRAEARRSSSVRSRPKASGTGRGYDSRPRAPRGGGRFGIRRAARASLPVELTA